MTFNQINDPISIKGQGHYKIFAGINDFKNLRQFLFNKHLRILIKVGKNLPLSLTLEYTCNLTI